MDLPKKTLEGQESEDSTTNKNKKATQEGHLPKNLNNSTNSKEDMPPKRRLFGRGTGYLGLPISLNKPIRIVLIGIIFGGLTFYFMVKGNWALGLACVGIANLFILLETARR